MVVNGDSKPFLIKTKVSSVKFVLSTVVLFNLLLFITLNHFNRPNDLILTISGATIVLGLMQVLAAIFFKYVIRGMNSLLGINIAKGKLDQIEELEIRNIWKHDDAFEEYRSNMVNLLSNRYLDIITLIISLIISISVSIAGILPGHVIAWGDDPYWVESSDPYALPVIIATFLITGWFLLGWISGAFLLIIFVIKLSLIGATENLGILQQDEIDKIEIDNVTGDEGRLLSRSLLFFKLYVKPVINFTTPISALGLIFIGIMGAVILGIFYAFFDGTLLILAELSLIGGALILSIITIMVYFVYPQWSFYRILSKKKKERLQNLSLSIEQKSIRWQFLDKNNDKVGYELKNQLNTDLQLLYRLFDEIEGVSPWIANYYQLISIIGSGSITILVYLIRIFVVPLLF